MAQYLLNTTAIWLISLLMYDLFLRRESYHSYNRFYLLFSFLLGALLPLYKWADDSIIYHTRSFQQPIDGMIQSKQQIVDATATAMSRSLNLHQWLMIIYITGVLVTLCGICIDIIKILAYHHAGKKTHQGKWTIIETGKSHTPFSLMNLLFVNSIAQYSSVEWQMLVHHEQRHTRLLHLADLVLIQLVQIVFWFHPLVYVYDKRLLLLHEYQADQKYRIQAQQYGHFLLDQAMLQSAPVLTHSFNRSPIKKRIVMLTRKSSAVAKTKMLVSIPLTLLCILLFTNNGYSRHSNNKTETIIYKGNKFEIQKSEFRGMINRTDSSTGKEYRDSIFNDAIPLKMNGRKIYNIYDDPKVKEPEFTGNEKDFGHYITGLLNAQFAALPDGKYVISPNLAIIDEKGKMVYFEFDCLYEVYNSGRTKSKHYEFNTAIKQTLNHLRENAEIKPAQLNGKPVAYYWFLNQQFEVKDHNVII